MKLKIFNGSPRGQKGNTKILVEWFLDTFQKDNTDIFYIRDQTKHQDMVKELIVSDFAMIAFPLYADAMPGILKKFIDRFEEYQGKLSGTKMIFLVHSGFPEAIHSRGVERYLKNLTRKLGAEYIGTIIKPGSEGIRIMPPFLTKKTKSILNELGKIFLKTKSLDQTLLKKLAKTERMSLSYKVFYKIFMWIGLTNFYWNNLLKKNKVYKNRFDAPYKDKE